MATVAKRACYFCQNKRTPDYKEVKSLQKFITGRKKILGRSKTGICRKHQRRLTMAVKRARHLALLPFVAKLKK